MGTSSTAPRATTSAMTAATWRATTTAAPTSKTHAPAEPAPRRPHRAPATSSSSSTPPHTATTAVPAATHARPTATGTPTVSIGTARESAQAATVPATRATSVRSRVRPSGRASAHLAARPIRSRATRAAGHPVGPDQLQNLRHTTRRPGALLRRGRNSASLFLAALGCRARWQCGRVSGRPGDQDDRGHHGDSAGRFSQVIETTRQARLARRRRPQAG